MSVRARSCAAFVAAAVVSLCLSAPSRATDDSDFAQYDGTVAADQDTEGTPVKLSRSTRHSRHHWTRHVSTRSKPSRVASRRNQRNVETVDVADAAEDTAAIPVKVANANAQMSMTEAPQGEAKVMADRAQGLLQPAGGSNSPAPVNQSTAQNQPGSVAASDQLNDLDRAIPSAAAAPAAAPVAPAPVVAAVSTVDSSQPAPEPQAVSARHDDSTWDKTSLIGKVFIAFGGLLTFASAARMFIA